MSLKSPDPNQLSKLEKVIDEVIRQEFSGFRSNTRNLIEREVKSSIDKLFTDKIKELVEKVATEHFEACLKDVQSRLKRTPITKSNIDNLVRDARWSLTREIQTSLNTQIKSHAQLIAKDLVEEYFKRDSDEVIG